MKYQRRQRKGAAAVFILFILMPLLAVMALSIDYGFLLYVRSDLQRTSDQAVIAAARDLIPDENGIQDLNRVRQTVREYVAMNLGDGFTIPDEDIEIGRYNPQTIYSSLELLNTGILDTVRLTIRRDDMTSSSVSLHFSRIFGRTDSDVSAVSTAVLQRGRYLGPGTSVFPFAMQEQTWDAIDQGDTVSIYGNGGVEDWSGNSLPGNWGTVDIGPSSNGTSSLSTQIENGLSQSDLNALNSQQAQGADSSADHIDADSPMVLGADTGLSSGLRHSVEAVEGTLKLVPIYSTASGTGNNATFTIIGWGAVEIVDSNWNGNNNTYIQVKKTYMFSGTLTPSNDLSNPSTSIEGAYTSPALIQ